MATYRCEYVKCGKTRCTCARDKGHGPYWYAYWKVAGKLRKRYVGKKPPRDYAREPAHGLPILDAYRAIGATAADTVSELKAAHRAAVLATHPDRGGNNAASVLVNAAWETIRSVRAIDNPRVRRPRRETATHTPAALSTTK